MSGNQSYSYSSYSASSYSSSQNDPAGTTNSQRYTEQSHSNDRDGTTTTRKMERDGQPVYSETRTTPAGQLIGNKMARDAGRIEDVTDVQQRENDRRYEENIEDEYAKREGGA